MEHTQTHTQQHPRWVAPVVYLSLFVVFVASIIYVSAFSSSAQVEHTSLSDGERSSLEWKDNKTPETVSIQHTTDKKYTHLINSPGLIVASEKDKVVRLDENTGDTLWEYSRPGGTVCDVESAWNGVVAVFDMGRGCSEIVKLNAVTGQYDAVASYATDQHDARLVFGGDNRLALATPKMVKILRDDLVTTSEFGTSVAPQDMNSTHKNGCTIFDVGIGAKAFAVSSKCEGDDNTHVTAVETEPEDSANADIVVDVQTGSQEPASISIVTLAQMQFVVPGTAPKVYTWKLDKGKDELSSRNVNFGEYGIASWDLDGFGYTWLVGENFHVRWGSEDVSQSKQQSGVIGNPLTADKNLLLPKRDGFAVWNSNENDSSTSKISVEGGLQGREYAFAGSTIVERTPEGSLNFYR